jgi:Ion transport protein.
VKKQIYHFLNEDKRFVQVIYGLIILNIIALILESYQEIGSKYGDIFWYIELISVIIFTLEYIARLYSSNADGSSRTSFCLSFYGVIDLIAFLPFYTPFLITIDLRIVRILRILRLTRVFKLGRYNKSFKTIKKVLLDTKEELIITMSIAFVLILLSSTLMYYAESSVQPEKFKSIGHSFWWAIATLTTVGYGDIYPITSTGKVLSSIIAIIGIGFVALPTGIISSSFIEQISENGERICPKCQTKVS